MQYSMQLVRDVIQSICPVTTHYLPITVDCNLVLVAYMIVRTTMQVNIAIRLYDITVMTATIVTLNIV
jgi:hypothetical protein